MRLAEQRASISTIRIKEHRDHFSLIEALMVVAVLLILFSFALPSLKDVIRKGNIVACASTLSQAHVALETYAEDHFDSIPRPVWTDFVNSGIGHAPWLNRGFSTPFGWGLLYAWDYLDSPKGFYCPSFPKAIDDTTGFFSHADLETKRKRPNGFCLSTYSYRPNGGLSQGSKFYPKLSRWEGLSLISDFHGDYEFTPDWIFRHGQTGFNVLYHDRSIIYIDLLEYQAEYPTRNLDNYYTNWYFWRYMDEYRN